MNRSGIKVMGKLIGLVKPLLHIMILAIFMGVLGFLCSIFITILGGFGLVNILGINTSLSLKTIFLVVTIFAVLRGILRYLEQASNHYIAFKILALIRNKVFTSLRKLAPAKLEGKDKGNLISIITSDIELLEVFYAHTISPIIIAFLTSLIMVIFIGKYNIVLGVIALLGYITVGVIIPIVSYKKGEDVGKDYRNNFGEMNSFFLDSLRGIRESIQYNATKKRLEDINNLTEKLDEKQKKLKDYEGNIKAVTDGAILTFSLLMLFVSIYLNSKNIINFEGVLISTISMMSSFGPVTALSNLANNLFHTLASGNRVLDILEEEPVVYEITNKKDISFESLKCENVNFSYDKEEILKEISLNIPKNKIVGIQGKSGSGKSTLLKLLMRFWDVNGGEIKISNENIKNINTSSLRDMESYVTQSTYLFNDTIKNNIKIAKENATMEEIIEASKKASLHEFIEKLPKGYETNVGELGDSLSGGEKQRIGIARAFLHNGPLILLDEPTSNLDSLNEGIILKSLKEECKDKTVVLVSHRKSTMNITDILYKMKGGRFS
ncbi:MAG: amino acid ABC transporter ATP-binding/permease protein [Clostridium sp.]|jgi:ATP-binding cassette subfamily C protein|nr:ABC transporter ATP-binding protein [Clostridium sp.]